MRIEMVRVGDRYFTEVERDDGAVVGLVHRIHRLPERTPGSVRETLETSLTPAVRSRAGLDTKAVLRMCRRLDDLGRRWTQLRNGGRLVLDWPARV